jgi:hypothetical protein
MCSLYTVNVTNANGEWRRPDEVNEFLSIYLTLPTALGLGVYSVSKQKRVREAEK